MLLRYRMVVACVVAGLAIALTGADDKKEEKVEKATVTIKAIGGKNIWDPDGPTVKEGDIVEWTIDSGTHGLAFEDGKKAREVLEFQKGGFEVKMQDFAAPIEATHKKNQGAEKKDLKDGFLVRAKVKAIPKGMTELPFFCTRHGTGMSGKLKF